MGNQYKSKSNGIDTRFSDLQRCSVKGAVTVAREMLGMKKRYFGGGQMAFGTLRHKMWEDEAKETGLTPEVFNDPPLGFQVEATYVEKEFALELAHDIVLHSRMDCVSVPNKMTIDYKTAIETVDPEKYKKSMQHLVYAYQLYAHGIYIDKGVYLVEQVHSDWKERLERGEDYILKYHKIEVDIKLSDILMIRDWLLVRTERLYVAMEWVKFHELSKDQLGSGSLPIDSVG